MKSVIQAGWTAKSDGNNNETTWHPNLIGWCPVIIAQCGLCGGGIISGYCPVEIQSEPPRTS